MIQKNRLKMIFGKLMKNLILCIGLVSVLISDAYSQATDTCTFSFVEYFNILDFSNANLKQFKNKKVHQITTFTTNNLKVVYTLSLDGKIINQKRYNLKTKLRTAQKKEVLIATAKYQYNSLGSLELRHYKMLKKKRLYQESYDSIVYNSKNQIKHYYAFNINGTVRDSFIYDFKLVTSTIGKRLLVDAKYSDSVLLDQNNQIIKYNSKTCLFLQENDSSQIEHIWDFLANFSKKIIKKETKKVNGQIRELTEFGNSYSEEAIRVKRYYNYDKKGQLLRISSRDNYRGISEFFVYYESGLLKEYFSVDRQHFSGKIYKYTKGYVS
jgi:hypothetical protein